MPTGLFKTPDQSAQIEYDGVSIPIPRSTYEKNGSKHRRAIVQEIGERLRSFLQEEAAPPGSLRTQNQPAPRTGRAVAFNHSLGQTSLLSRLGQRRRPMGARCHQ
jgi:hypothetical protein